MKQAVAVLVFVVGSSLLLQVGAVRLVGIHTVHIYLKAQCLHAKT